jgi:MYXO-CTERM domain-containing protein
MKLMQLPIVGFTSLVVLAPLQALAAEYYVSPTGSDSNAGTQAAPFATLQKANNSAAAGDTIWMRAGTYNCTTQITLSKSGTSDTNRTKIWAYTGEVPILDFSNYGAASSAADNPAIVVTGSWMHLKGLEIGPAKVGSSGSHSYSLLRTKNASNNTFELLNIHNGFGPGLFIDTGTGGNLILNCDSHDNYDINGSQGDGQNGDGFGVHYQTTGPSTIIRGCRAWHNSDDGYDLIYQEVPVIVENSFATGMGYGTSGNGNGFKMGSSGTGIRHLVQNNVAWANKDSGFYANHSSGGNTWYNNTSYNNGTQYNMLASSFEADGRTIATAVITLTGTKVHIMRNNIGFPNKNANMTGVDTQFNSWDLGITPAASDFASISDTGCTGPRQADGSMPAACSFMHLTAGSRMIDKGTDVGLPYVGAAPDLGAYEYGAANGGSPGAGGAPATGGSPSTGGTKATTGGTMSTGGSKATGGTTSVTTTSVTAGGTATTTGTGGSKATGGVAAAAGGTISAGGTPATGGAAVVSTGGAATSAGGVNGTGGLNPGGGTPSTGGLAGGIGGAPAATGGVAALGGSTSGTGPDVAGAGGNSNNSSDSSGSCSCRVAGQDSQTGAWSALGVLGLAFIRRMRRRRST